MPDFSPRDLVDIVLIGVCFALAVAATIRRTA